MCFEQENKEGKAEAKSDLFLMTEKLWRVVRESFSAFEVVHARKNAENHCSKQGFMSVGVKTTWIQSGECNFY